MNGTANQQRALNPRVPSCTVLHAPRPLLDSLPVPSSRVATPQNITTADDFYRNKAICSLPDVPELRNIPGLDLYPTTGICNAMYGIRSYKVKGLPGGPAQNIEVGAGGVRWPRGAAAKG